MDSQNVAILLSRNDLRAMGIAYSNVHLLRLEGQEKFPKRIYLSASRVVWLREEVMHWIEERARRRDPPISLG